MKTPKPKKTWPAIRKRKNAGGTVSWCVDPGKRLGKRERFYFATEPEAKAKAEALRVRLKNEGKSSAQLSDRDRAEAAECVRQLRPYGVGIPEAVAFYVSHHKPRDGADANLEQLLKEFLEHLTENKKSPSYIAAVSGYIGPFAKDLPGPVHLLTSTVIVEWSKKRTKSMHSRYHFASYLKTLFHWARDMKKALPKGETEADLVIAAKAKPAVIEVYTPAEMRILLKFAATPAEVALLSLGGFVGLRNSEITGERTSHGPLQAADILFEGDAVRTVQKVQNQSVDRFAPMSKNAASWLLPLKGTTGPVIECRMANAVLQAIIARANAAGESIEFKRNGLRRSHITYRMTITGDAARTADECGTSPEKIRANYRRPGLERVAKEWCAIRPEK